MSEGPKRASGPRGPWVLVACLYALAVISAVGGLLIGGAVGVQAVGAGAGMLAGLCWIAGGPAAGCVIAALLCGLAWLCRQQHQQGLVHARIADALERLPGGGWRAGEVATVAVGTGEALAALASAPPPPGASPRPQRAGEPADASPAGPSAKALLAELRELNVNLLLSDEQRALKRQHLTRHQAHLLVQHIDSAVSAGDWPAAAAAVEQLFRIAPDWPKLAETRQRVASARQAADERALAAATARAEDLMAIGHFAQAEGLVRELLAGRGDLPGAADLLARVRREGEAYTAEQRGRMYAEVDAKAHARQWRAALAAGEALLEAYPASPEADSVRAQIATIRDNARLEEVRGLRDRISDLISRRRYGEAIELAGEVVEKFPDTAAAEELRGQMDRLKELKRAAEQAT